MVAFLEDYHALHGIPLLDGVDRVDSVLDPSKDGVLAVEVGLGTVGDEELAAVGSGTGICHREDARSIVSAVRHALVTKAIAGAPRAGAFGTSPLDHEIRNDAVEAQVVVKTLFRERDDVRHRVGRIVLEQFDGDVAALCLDLDLG